MDVVLDMEEALDAEQKVAIRELEVVQNIVVPMEEALDVK